MQILLVVLSMLLLIASMTYTQMARFVNFHTLRIEYERHMREESHRWMNRKQELFFEANTRGQNSSAKNPGGQGSFSKLNIYSLLDRETEGGEDRSVEQQFLRTVLRRLMATYYSSFPLYKALSEKFPSLPDAVISGMIDNVKALPCNQTLSNVVQLGRIPFEDPSLRELYYLMLKGGDDVPGLIDLLTLKKGKAKLRVYLSPPALLAGVFSDTNAVKQFLLARQKTWGAIRRKEISSEDATNQLQSDFSPYLVVDPNFIDFKASSTRPPR
ncbi:MAG: hypothetical protein KDK40_04820 [Chlamydiia bacterium]|nr:hypothetical protein [Chlamydiia bacterium]